MAMPVNMTAQSNTEILPSESTLNYWRGILVDTESCIVPESGSCNSDAEDTIDIRLAGDQLMPKVCEQHGLAPQDIFLTAWALVLRYYAGVSSVCFLYSKYEQTSVSGYDGSPRPLTSIFICRAELKREKPVVRAAEEIQTALHGHSSHAMNSASMLQRLLDLYATPLFNTEVKIRKTGSLDSFLSDGRSFDRDVEGTHKLGIVVDISESGEQRKATLTYNTKLIPKTLAQNISEAYEKAIRRIMENPNQEIGSIDLCNNRDITQIQQWNSSPVDTVESCVHELIELQAINYPDAPAVHSWDDKFSYQRLDNLSSRLAQHLLSLGVGPEIFVPFYIEKSAWAVVAILSILKAGGAFVPIDLGQPLSRLEEIVRQVSAKVLFVSPQGPSSVPGIESIIQVSPAMEQWLPEATALSHVKVKPSNASYIMFTSGSTGKPKGVIMEHAAASTSMVGQRERMRFGPTTRAFQFASFSFDVSLLEILTPLIHGGCVCMPSERERVDSLAQAMTAMDVNWSCMTNTVARLLRPDDVPCLETMFCGGEKVTEDVSQKWAPKLNFNQGYGPTEACIVCTMRPMPPGRNDVHNIGTSISSLSWVVHKDDHHCLLPVGSIGELLVEGPILARGYLNDPDKTANAFIENPAWTVEKGAPVRPRRLYKTGDLVKYNEDGSLTIVGRKDRQVKLHGQRIEPGEIEFQLRQVVSMAAGVDAEVAVEIITTADQRAQQLLAAFIHIVDERKSMMSEPSLGAGPWPLVGEVKSRLLDLLPKHMVPSAYIPINNMPMTTSGKLDRAYLRQIGARLSMDKLIGYMGVTRNYRAPISSQEKDLQLLWSEVLAVDANTIGAEDNFFTLGGDSLLAIKMVSLARTHGLSLTFEGIFNNAQLSKMALTMGVLDDLPAETVENFSLIDGSESKETIWEEIISQCGVKAEEVEDFYMTTPTQDEGMRSHIIDPRVWVGKYAYEIPAEYDIGRFRSAWEDVVASNAILRTRFVKLDSVRSVQVVLKETIKWGHGDSLDGYFRHVASLALGFGKPLAHYAIINDVNTGARYFLWILHHGLYDGWSVSKLYEQVSRRYHGESPAPLPGFKFFVKYLLEKDNRASDDFWRDQLSNVTPPHFPLYPSASFYPITTGRVQLNLDLPHRPGSQTTAAMIIQAAWAMVLAEYEQRIDVVFGSSVAGRNEPVRGIESLIGPTMTIVPFHLRVEYNQTAKEFLENVKKKAIAMIPFQQRDLSSIRALSADARAACDIRTYLIVAPFDMTDSFPGLRKVTGQYQQAQQAPFPVVVQCKINREGVLIGIGFDERVTSENQMRQILRKLGLTIRAFAHETPGQTLQEIRSSIALEVR